MTRTMPPITWTEVVAPDSIVAMCRPAVAKRIEWLECYAEKPTRDGKTTEEFMELWTPNFRRSRAIAAEYADALNGHRWEVREWALDHPELRGKPRRDAGLSWMVDGVECVFCERHGAFLVSLSGDDWRKIKAAKGDESSC